MTHWTEQLYKENPENFIPFLDRRFDNASEEARQLLRLLEEQRGLTPERVLDVACGTGRHVIAFADEGYDAEGLDFSPEFIDRARERATELGVEDRATFEVADMRELEEWTGSYDLVTNFWNSIGYYDRETDVEILSEMRQLLSDSGVVALEMSNKEFHVNNFESSGVRQMENELHVERREFDLETGRFPTTIDIFSIEDSGYEYRDTIEWENRLYAPVELRELFEAAGFDQVSLHSGFRGGPISLASPSVVVLAS